MAIPVAPLLYIYTTLDIVQFQELFTALSCHNNWDTMIQLPFSYVVTSPSNTSQGLLEYCQMKERIRLIVSFQTKKGQPS